MGAATKPLTAPIKAAIKPYVNAALEFILGKKGRLKRTEKTQLTRAANKFAKNNSEYTADEFIGLAHKFVKDKKANPIPTKKSGEFTPKKPNPQSTKGKGSKGSNKGLTPAERKEKAGLISQSRKDMQATRKGEESPDVGTGSPPGGRERILIPVPGSKRQRIVAHPQNPLKGSQQFSKAELENMNEAEKLEYALRGIGGSGSAMEAGRKVSSKGDMDTQSKKRGGTVKRNMGGPVRGVGKATRGFGKATYSNKLY
tara:strand:+ start:145 stop:912 length:768 start_codon:yes stop_codon:yes gene_type:complete